MPTFFPTQIPLESYSLWWKRLCQWGAQGALFCKLDMRQLTLAWVWRTYIVAADEKRWNYTPFSQYFEGLGDPHRVVFLAFCMEQGWFESFLHARWTWLQSGATTTTRNTSWTPSRESLKVLVRGTKLLWQLLELVKNVKFRKIVGEENSTKKIPPWLLLVLVPAELKALCQIFWQRNQKMWIEATNRSYELAFLLLVAKNSGQAVSHDTSATSSPCLSGQPV